MGRIPRVARRKYQIQYLWDKHHEVKRLALLGFTNKKVANLLECTPENICAITGSELFKREIQAARAARDSASIDVARAIQNLGPKALGLLDAVLENDKETIGEHAPISLRANVAQDLLDRHAKTAKVKHIDGDFRVSHLVGEETIKSIKDRAKEIEAEFSIVEDEEEEHAVDDLRRLNQELQAPK